MPCPVEFLRETHIIGRRCRELMLDSTSFPVLRNAPFIWIGLSVLRPPYRMVRLRSVHSHVLVCVEGRGRALVGGRAVSWRPGEALLAPVGVHHAFEIEGSGPWTLAWVFYEDHETAPVLRSREVELVRGETEDFVSSVRMLTREASGSAQPQLMEALVTLLDGHARRLAGARAMDGRLQRLWARVELDLAHPWSVAEMASLACVSEEHLRRLCLRDCQRGPGAHLAHLRLRRSATMLRSSPAKLDEIALRVGYSSVYSFAAAFRRWAGVPPARYRRGEEKEAGFRRGACS